jgi:hypothetical protein
MKQTMVCTFYTNNDPKQTMDLVRVGKVDSATQHRLLQISVEVVGFAQK